MRNWLIWQLVDSAYPGGALAHSNGLEAARQAGVVTDAESLAAFAAASLRQTRRALLPFLLATHRQPDSLLDWDRALDLRLNNHVAHRASRAQGHAMIASAARIFGIEEMTVLARGVRERVIPGHLATLFGAITRWLEVDATEAGQMLLFLTARGIVSSAVRLGIVGPLEGQSLQAKLKIETADTAAEPTGVQTAPILDLIQMTQDRLYSRLFQS